MSTAKNILQMPVEDEQKPEVKFIQPGIYPNMSNEDYHGSEGVSKTKLDLFDRDQAALEWAKNCPVDEEKLKTLDFGDAMHAICLEPDRLKNDFVVLPKLNLRTNADKERLAELKIEYADKTILTAEEYKKLTLMFDSVMAHPEARQLIELPGVSEQSYYWTDPDTGVLCKCRPDRNITGLPWLVDVKSTDLISKFKFSVDDYRYYVQDPFYTDGTNVCGEENNRFIFLVIQKTIELGRYPVMCVSLPEEVVSYGRDQYKQNLDAYAEAKHSGRYAGIYELEMHYGFMKKLQTNY